MVIAMQEILRGVLNVKISEILKSLFKKYLVIWLGPFFHILQKRHNIVKNIKTRRESDNFGK